MPSVYRTKDRNGIPHPNWRIRYMDWKGERQSCVGLPSKVDTQKLAWKIQTEHDEIRKGLRPPPRECDKPRLFREVADEYLAWGMSQGGHGRRPWSKVHQGKRTSLLLFWERRLGLKMMAELCGSLPRVEKVLRDLQSAGQTGKPCSGKTLQNYAETIAAFCDWAVRREYLAEDPLKHLEGFDTSPTFVRRAMTQDEVTRLLAVSPVQRRVLYVIAMITGLRAGELRQLLVSDFERNQGWLTLRKVFTKNGKDGFQPLHAAVVSDLTELTTGKQHSDRLLNVPADAAGMLHRDLKAADIPVWTTEGKLDFHALRTSFATFIVESGANVKELQALMRHSTPDLSMRLYARCREHPLQNVVSAIGDLLLAPSQTSVKQEGGQEPSSPANPGTETSSGARALTPSEGSIPSEAIGPNEANVGQQGPQVGQAEGLARESHVDPRTQPVVQPTTFGHVECQTNGKRLPEDFHRLAEVWPLLTDDVRLSILNLAFNNRSGVSGFSGHRPDPVNRPTLINGFSGFSNRAA